MLDTAAIAASLYGSGAPPVEQPAGDPPEAPPIKSHAEVLYGPKASEEPEPRPDGEPPSDAEALFGKPPPVDRTYEPASQQIERDAIDRLGLDPEQAAAAGAEWAGVFREFGVSSSAVSQLVDLGVHAMVEPPSDEQVDQWAGDAHDHLQGEYGAGAARVLADARALIAKQPGVAAWLNRTGLGNHPNVVRVVAHHAWGLRRAGAAMSVINTCRRNAPSHPWRPNGQVRPRDPRDEPAPAQDKAVADLLLRQTSCQRGRVMRDEIDKEQR